MRRVVKKAIDDDPIWQYQWSVVCNFTVTIIISDYFCDLVDFYTPETQFIIVLTKQLLISLTVPLLDTGFEV